ncbi:uncharacterized protein LOC106153176 [Lingula anatina]|uniref:Uncharacterized protein LOC106153176 n=1 Tax=Lingula anatina TaxID=7574 RepID=A0A1S3H8Y2_LINAN|nr:uncharacterized protein LOC106153176 [Lingula anatina]|eukprot:XP_013382462.1 uncharacterized protein LOC106153176 [Lingula anatina]
MKEEGETLLSMLQGGIFHAISRERFKQVRLLVEKGLNVNIKNAGENGKTPLIASLLIENAEKRERMFKFLMNHGANPLECDYSGRDALAWACILGRCKAAEAILQDTRGEINLHHGDRDGLTALHYSTMYGHEDCVKLVATTFNKYGLSLDIADNNGLTPYLHAKKLGFREIATFLFQQGASPYKCDTKNNMTAEQWAAIGLQERKKRAVQDRKKADDWIKIQGKNNSLFDVKHRKLSISLPEIQITSPNNKVRLLKNDSLDTIDGISVASRLRRNYQSSSIKGMSKSLNSLPDSDTTECDSSTSSSFQRVGVARDLSDYMSTLSDQASGSYRKPAQPLQPVLEKSEIQPKLTKRQLRKLNAANTVTKNASSQAEDKPDDAATKNKKNVTFAALGKTARMLSQPSLRPPPMKVPDRRYTSQTLQTVQNA